MDKIKDFFLSQPFDYFGGENKLSTAWFPIKNEESRKQLEAVKFDNPDMKLEFNQLKNKVRNTYKLTSKWEIERHI